MQLRPLALGMTLSAVACTGAMAQGAGQTLPAQGVTTQRDLGFGTQILVLYDNNSARTGKVVAQQRNLKAQEFTFTPTLTFRATQPIGQESLFVNGSFGYQFHEHNTVLNRETYVVNGGGAARLGLCQASIVGFIRASQADIQDLDPLTTKNLRSTSGEGVSLQCGRPSGFGANMSIQNTETKNSEPRLRISDADGQTITAGVGYRHPTLGTFGVSYVYDSSAFPNRIIPGRPIGDGYFNESFGITAQRSFGRASLSLVASRFNLKREFVPPGTSQKLKGQTYAIQGSYGLGSRINFQGGVSRSIQPSGRPGKLFDVAQSANVAVSYKLGSRFDIKLDQAYGKVTSNRDTLTPLIVITESRINSTTATLNYTQSSKISFGLTARYDERKTNLPQVNYSASSCGFRAGATF